MALIDSLKQGTAAVGEAGLEMPSFCIIFRPKVKAMKRGDWLLLGYFGGCFIWAIVQAWLDNRQLAREKPTEAEGPSTPQRPAA
jgi:hypothetical protein